MKTVKRNILLNPGPATTTDTVKNALVVPDICPREKEFGVLLDSIRHDLVKVVNGCDEYISVVFAGSGTAAVESAISSVVPKDKKILIIDNGAYGTRMRKIAETYGIEVVNYQIAYGDYPDLGAIDLLLQHNTDISHLAVIHHETTTGMLNPVKEISEIAHRYDVEVIVDAMSSFAGMEIDIKDYNVEYLVSSSNKCIQGMAGMSFVITRRDCLEELGEVKRSFYLDLKSQHDYFEKTRQMQFTPPVQIVYALRQAIDEYLEETGKGRAARLRENFHALYDGVKALGFKTLLPEEQESGLLLAVCDPEDKRYNFEHMHDYLYDRGYTIYPGKGARKSTFRLAVIGDMKKFEVESFLKELKEYLKDANITSF
jgi:2-aminoethylphosphonate aminotransferase